MPVHVNTLMNRLQLDSMTPLLAAYKASGHTLHGALDGGAGSGSTADLLLKHINGTVYAFEPFPGNHQFFTENERVVLFKAALAEQPSEGKLYVSSTVAEDSPWGKRGMAGYSSAGFLIDEKKASSIQPANANKLFDVDCVAADDVIPAHERVDIVKLDLQGGELNALRGMKRVAHNAKVMWIEYSAQPGLAAYLVDEGFMLFDTPYLFLDTPADQLADQFTISRKDVVLSNGRSACFAYANAADRGDYEQWFNQAKRELNMVQTDLVCVHRDKLEEFLNVAVFICPRT